MILRKDRVVVLPAEMQVKEHSFFSLLWNSTLPGAPPPEAPSSKYKAGANSQAFSRTNSMREVPGGSYKIGTDDQIIPADREGPAKVVELQSFFLDVHEVSNAEFSLFVEETGYKTEAETFGNSFVADYYVSEEVKATITQAVAAAPWWLPVEVLRVMFICISSSSAGSQLETS